MAKNDQDCGSRYFSFVPARRFHRQKCYSLTIPAIGDILRDVRSADCVRDGQQRRVLAIGRPYLQRVYMAGVPDGWEP